MIGITKVKHEQRIVQHVSGWKEHLPTCVCGEPWPHFRYGILCANCCNYVRIDNITCPICGNLLYVENSLEKMERYT